MRNQESRQPRIILSMAKFSFFFVFRQLIKGQVPPVGLGGNKQAINAIKLGGGGGGRRVHILRVQRFGQRIDTKT